MDPEMSFSANGSRLLSESLILPPFTSQTGPGGDDLSISELSLSDRPYNTLEKPFNLLALHPAGPPTPVQADIHIHDGEHSSSEAHHLEHAEKEERNSSKAREEKLQNDVFMLKKLNVSFALFNDALQDTESANQRIAVQLEQTDALLNKYIDVLSRSEEVARLIFDEHWRGAEEDEETLEGEIKAERERARREAEERLLAAKVEEERRQREQKELLEREETKRAEQERKERTAARGTSRSMRGTRTSMQATRGMVSRGAVTGVPSSQRRLAGATNAQPGRTVTSKLHGIRSNSTRGSSRGT